MSETSKMSYKEAFHILNTNTQRLRSNEEGEDIDSLVEIMEQSTEAYKLCMERIEAVKKAMEKYSSQLEQHAPLTETISPVSTKKIQETESNLLDDDIPF